MSVDCYSVSVVKSSSDYNSNYNLFAIYVIYAVVISVGKIRNCSKRRK